MNGSLQASGKSARQPSRVEPNTASWLRPTTLRIRMLAPLQRGEGAVEISPADAHLGEHDSASGLSRPCSR